MKTTYILIGGPADGQAVETDSDAKLIGIPVRTEKYRINRYGEELPIWDEAKYKLCGMTGEYVEGENG